MTNETPEQVKQMQPDNQLGLEEYQEKLREEHEEGAEPEIPETVPISTQEVVAASPRRESPRREPSKRYLEGMSMIELKNSVHEESCNHCKMALTGDPQHRVFKKGSAKKICRQCHNTVTLLYKNVDVSKLQWGEVPEEKMKDFFREAKSMAASSGRLIFSKLKTVLQQTLVESEKMLTATRIQGKFLPLSVWQQKGYDTKKILATAEKRDSAMLLVLRCLKYVVCTQQDFNEAVKTARR